MKLNIYVEEVQRQLAGRRRGGWRGGPRAGRAAHPGARLRAPADAARGAGRGGRRDHPRARPRLGGPAAARPRAGVRGHRRPADAAPEPPGRAARRRRGRPDGAHQPPAPRPAQDPHRAGRRARRPLDQRLAGARRRRRGRPRRRTPPAAPAARRPAATAGGCADADVRHPRSRSPATVEVGVGDVRVAAGERADTVVEVRPSDPDRRDDVLAAEQTRVEFTGGRLLVKAPKNVEALQPVRRRRVGRRRDRAAGGLRSSASAPAWRRVRATGTLGDTRFTSGGGRRPPRAHAARCALRTGVGAIEVDQVAGDADVRTGSGRYSIGAIDGSAMIKNSNGDSWIGEAAGDLRVNAANGDIAVDRAQRRRAWPRPPTATCGSVRSRAARSSPRPAAARSRSASPTAPPPTWTCTPPSGSVRTELECVRARPAATRRSTCARAPATATSRCDRA